MRAIIIHGLYTFYTLFQVHLCTATFGLIYLVSIQERVILGIGARTVFLSHQNRKSNSFVCFLGEVMARQFCFEIY